MIVAIGLGIPWVVVTCPYHSLITLLAQSDLGGGHGKGSPNFANKLNWKARALLALNVFVLA